MIIIQKEFKRKRNKRLNGSLFSTCLERGLHELQICSKKVVDEDYTLSTTISQRDTVDGIEAVQYSLMSKREQPISTSESNRNNILDKSDRNKESMKKSNPLQENSQFRDIKCKFTNYDKKNGSRKTNIFRFPSCSHKHLTFYITM